MKRTAFTMIELIFVIVILGILASVAIPKLASVQDDATIATEKAVVGAARSGVSILRGKRITRKADFDITLTNLKGMDMNLAVTTNSKSFYPNGLNVSAYTETGVDQNLTIDTTSDLSTTTPTLPRVLVAVVEMDGVTEWTAIAAVANTAGDGNVTELTGPAGNTVTDANAEIHSGMSTQWLYDSKTGNFQVPTL